MNSLKIDKGTQVLNYFAIAEGGSINKMKSMKLTWLADRYHLRKYGRSITDDRYIAMKFGPVPSSIKDIAQKSPFCSEEISEYADKFIKPSSGNLSFTSLAPIDEDVFSDTDLEALKFAYDHFGKFDQFVLADISHAYPEWKRRNEEGKLVLNDMSYLDFFDNPDLNDPNLAPLSNQDPFQEDSSSVANSKEVFKANKDLEKLWY